MFHDNGLNLLLTFPDDMDMKEYSTLDIETIFNASKTV